MKENTWLQLCLSEVHHWLQLCLSAVQRHWLQLCLSAVWWQHQPHHQSIEHNLACNTSKVCLLPNSLQHRLAHLVQALGSGILAQVLPRRRHRHHRTGRM